MRCPGSRMRRRPGHVLAALLALGFGAAAPLGAQEPPPRPPVPPTPVPADTAGAVADTAAAPDTVPVPDPAVQDSGAGAADTLEPVEVLVSFPRPDASGWRAGVWEWDRAALLASSAVTLTDLLERIPGAVPIRYGSYGNAEAVSLWGATAGLFEIVLDGYALDPLDGGVYDIGRLELVNLERVRVERVAGGVRVELETLAPVDHRPYSLVEAGTGQPRSNVFRGLFQAPRVLGGPLSLGIDRIDSRGMVVREPANAFTGWAKWGLIRDGAGLQLELRRSTAERTGPNGESLETARQDLILRARGAPAEGLTAEMFAGITGLEGGAAGADERIENTQLGARATFHTPLAWARAGARLRTHTALPIIEAEFGAGARPLPFLALNGDVRWSDWRDGRSGVAYSLRSELGPVLGVRPFAEFSAGPRGAPLLTDDEMKAVLLDRTAFRVGGELEIGRIRLGVARIGLSADSVPGFGLAFERPAAPDPADAGDGTGEEDDAGGSPPIRVGTVPAGDLVGWEVTGRIPLFWEPLALEGWYARWSGARSWLYTPAQSWRAGLVYHHLPLPSGNLEIVARLEARHRGWMNVLEPTGIAPVPAQTALDFGLNIRVMDVHAFLRWENVTARAGLHDLPGRPFARHRLLYGIKWSFWN